MMVPAKFIGGSLDGTSRPDVCARRYLVPVRENPIVRSVATIFVPQKIRTEVYERSATRYVDGGTRASDDNQGRVSHLEYTYRRTVER